MSDMRRENIFATWQICLCAPPFTQLTLNKYFEMSFDVLLTYFSYDLTTVSTSLLWEALSFFVDIAIAVKCILRVPLLMKMLGYTQVPRFDIQLEFSNHFTVNPLFTLDIFICSFCKCIQHTTRGQSKFPLSKLWCCYIFIVLKCWW